MIRVKDKRMDLVVLTAVMILLLIGILMVYSASSYRGAEKYNDSFQFVKQHVLRVLIGVVLLFIFSKIDYHILYMAAPILFLAGLGLLILVLMTPEFHGTHRSMLFFEKRFQPSEFMKLIVIIYIAAVYSKGSDSPGLEGKTLLIHCLLVMAAVGLVFIEPDLSTAIVLFLVSFFLFFLGGVKWKNLCLMALPPVVLVCIGGIIFNYQLQRLTNYIASVFNPEKAGYQIKQSIIGLANGGLMGVGYGGGKQKLFFLPEPFSDFILSSLGEELGFIGMMFVFILLSIILWRSIQIALRAPDRFGYLVVGGITVMISISAILNGGVVVNLLPTTGLPFPFLSYGGSSILTNLIGIGIILNISKKKNK